MSKKVLPGSRVGSGLTRVLRRQGSPAARLQFWGSRVPPPSAGHQPSPGWPFPHSQESQCSGHAPRTVRPRDPPWPIRVPRLPGCSDWPRPGQRPGQSESSLRRPLKGALSCWLCCKPCCLLPAADTERGCPSQPASLTTLVPPPPQVPVCSGVQAGSVSCPGSVSLCCRHLRGTARTSRRPKLPRVLRVQPKVRQPPARVETAPQRPLPCLSLGRVMLLFP